MASSPFHAPHRVLARQCVRICGFTLIELLVVLAIVAMLLTLALPRYLQSVDGSKETVLVSNLATARATIDKFYADTGRYPESLEELVDLKYLRAVPFDPVADNSTGWVIVAPESPARGSVYSIRSSAPGQNRHGQAFADL